MTAGAELWLPGGHYDREHFDAAQDAQTDVEAALEFRRRLRAHDSTLDLIWIRKDAPSFNVDQRWAIVRRNPNAPPTYWVIHDGEGGYSPPTEGHFERLKALDVSARRGGEDHWRRARERERLASERRRELGRQERVGASLERIRHHFDVSVSVPATARTAAEREGARNRAQARAMRKHRRRAAGQTVKGG